MGVADRSAEPETQLSELRADNERLRPGKRGRLIYKIGVGNRSNQPKSGHETTSRGVPLFGGATFLLNPITWPEPIQPW